jgi:TPR repeat protein
MKKGILFVLILSLNASTYIVESYIKNCNRGNKISCAILGLMYNSVEYVEKNVTKAIKYYKKACFLKEKNSCFKLYNYFKNKNIKLARYFLQKACEYNQKKACIIWNKDSELLSKKTKLLSKK